MNNKKLISILAIVIVVLILSGCISNSNVLIKKVKDITSVYGALSGEIRFYKVTFDEGNTYIKDTIYMTRDDKIIEKLHKAFIQNKTVIVGDSI